MKVFFRNLKVKSMLPLAAQSIELQSTAENANIGAPFASLIQSVIFFSKIYIYARFFCGKSCS